MITLSIDVTKLDKGRLKEFARRDGTAGKSLELVIFETRGGKLLVKQSCTKEERDARLEMPILGEARDWSKENARTQQPVEAAAKRQPAVQGTKPLTQPESDDVPF